MIALLLTLAAHQGGPTLELPPEEEEAAPTLGEQAIEHGLGLGDVDEHELLRGLQDARLRSGRTILGGYGQINGTAISVGPGENGEMIGTPAYSASVRRLVLFVAHTFDAGPRIYTEFEWENAIACRSCVGSVEIEQSFVELPIVKTRDRDVFAVRAGLLLVPMGILNQWHEPPVFHGVERSRVEEGGVIPSTWRELGAGVAGTALPGLRYEAYLTTGFDPFRLRDSGFASARSNGGLAPSQSLQASARVEVEPILGFLVGVSGIAGDMGGAWLGARPFALADGTPLGLTLPIYALEGDARVRRDGFEARALVASFFMPNSGDLMLAHKLDGSKAFPVEKGGTGAVPTRLLGASLEIAYDVLRLVGDTEQQLLPFARVEFYDSQSDVPQGFLRDPFFDVREATAGLSYRPIQQIVLKADVQARNRRRGFDEAQANLGLGFMF